MKRFENAVWAVAKALAVLSSVTVLLMMIQTVVDVTSNNLLGRPIEGNAEIIAAYYMVMIVFLPLAFVELRHEHINADLLVRSFPPPARRAVYAFGALVSLGFFGVLTWQTGYPFGVNFFAGYPRFNPGEFSGPAMLARGEIDRSLSGMFVEQAGEDGEGLSQVFSRLFVWDLDLRRDLRTLVYSAFTASHV